MCVSVSVCVCVCVFVGSGIPRDGMEMVGERYGVHFIVVVSFFFLPC